MSTSTTVAQANVDTTAYEPYLAFDAVLSGDPAARVAWLRTTSGGEGVLYTGMFTAQPSMFRYSFAGDESMLVLEGDLDVAVDGGATLTFRAGDTASFPKGVRSTWTLRAPLRKFFVISG